MMKALWSDAITVQDLMAMIPGTLMEHLDIRIVELGPNYMVATMPVDSRTKQPYGILHGGATASLAETLGSFASHIAVASTPGSLAVGTSLVIHHLDAVREGKVTGKVTPIRIGRTMHVWDIRIRDDKDRLVSQATLTVKILEPRNPGG